MTPCCPSLSAGSGWGVHTPVRRRHVCALPRKHPRCPPGSQLREPADGDGCRLPDASLCLSPAPLAWSWPLTSTVTAHKLIKPSMLIGCDSSFSYLTFSYRWGARDWIRSEGRCQSPLFGPPLDAGWGSESSARTSCKPAVYGHTASSNNLKHDFTLGMRNTLPQEDMEAGREVGLKGYLAPTGENCSFQGCSTQGLDLKPPSWEDAQDSTWYPALPKLLW